MLKNKKSQGLGSLESLGDPNAGKKKAGGKSKKNRRDFSEDLEVREFDDLEAREFDDLDLEARDDEFDLEARDFDELDARDISELEIRDLHELFVRETGSKLTLEQMTALVKAMERDPKAKKAVLDALNMDPNVTKVTHKLVEDWTTEDDLEKRGLFPDFDSPLEARDFATEFDFATGHF